MSDELIRINGTIQKIVYQNEQNWYSICDVEAEDNTLYTFVGVMPYVSVGEGIEAEGKWVVNRDYGKQFKVESYKKLLPKQKNSILKYLSSGAVKGIGAKIAQKIVSQYGEDSFDVIANHPDWLAQINGISRKKAYEMSNDFKEKTDIRELLEFSSGSISAPTAIKISKRWGRNALGVIKSNPYILCEDEYGISFKRADEIAINSGISINDENRIKSGILYVLRVFASRDGHTYVKIDALVNAVTALLNVSEGLVRDALNREISGVSIIREQGEIRACISNLYFAEMNIARRLKKINRQATVLQDAGIEYMLADIERRMGIKFAALQKRAIWESVKNGVTVLTGGPGTGKTTIIKALIAIFDRLGLKCALCAPTGRAAKKMSEATQNEAKTIHRLLEFNIESELSNEPKFLRNSSTPISEDVIIVDEVSMMDVRIMSSLMVAIKFGARLIMIGDVDQLPSVGEGNVLNDIIESKCFSVVCLNEIFRQAKNSGIVVNAHRINRGEYPDFDKKYEDFFFVGLDDGKMPEYIAELCKNRIPKKYGPSISDDIQVISPSKKGVCGINNLNHVLQDYLNPPSGEKSEFALPSGKKFRAYDKVMQLKNNYELEWSSCDSNERGAGVFNGDIGIIKGIYRDNDIMEIDFGGKMVEYRLSGLEEIDHSYAVTVHKSQGSEYSIVIVALPKSAPPMLLTRNLLYTAITRAQKMVILVGDKRTLEFMVDNKTHVQRNTFLKELINKD